MTAAWAPDPIPAATIRLHLEPPWRSDSERGIKTAGGKGKRGKSSDIDRNLLPCDDGVIVMHWNNLLIGGWLHIQEGKKRRALTKKELATPVSEWKRADLVRLRRTKRRGLSYESRVRPLAYVEDLALCRKYGARPNYELKARFGRRRAMTMVDQANAARVTVFWMTLAHQGLKAPAPGYSMAVAGERLSDFHAAKGQTALLAHNYPRPSDLDEWRPFIDRIWGHWA